MTLADWIPIIVVYLVAAVVGCGALYWIIRLAVTHALRAPSVANDHSAPGGDYPPEWQRRRS